MEQVAMKFPASSRYESRVMSPPGNDAVAQGDGAMSYLACAFVD